MNSPLLLAVRDAIAAHLSKYDAYSNEFADIRDLDKPGNCGTFAAWVLWCASEYRDYSFLMSLGDDVENRISNLRQMQSLARAELGIADRWFAHISGSAANQVLDCIDSVLRIGERASAMPAEQLVGH